MNTVLISTLARQEHVINGDDSWPTTLSQIGWTKARMTLRSTTLLVRLSTSLNIFKNFGGTSGKTSIRTQL